MYKKAAFILLLSLCLSVQSCADKSSDSVAEPFIHSISTQYDGNKAVALQPVTLIGKNFSPVPSENKVLYGVGLDAVSIPVQASSENHVEFIAPDLSKKQISIRVSTKGKESNSVTLEYTTAPDYDPEDDTPTITLDGATTVTICPGVEWTTFHGVWEGQMRNINIVKTTINEHNHLGLYYNYYDNGYKFLDEKCKYLDAVAGTNGPMACCHFVRVDGTVRRVANEQDPWICNCALTIDGDVIDIAKVKNNYDAALLTNRTVGCAGPLLVWEGVIQEYPEYEKEDFIAKTHPRTAFGISRDGKTVIQVAVDGRYTTNNAAKRAIGMSTALLSKFMKGLGCYKALNFDGGGGTAMWVYGQGDKGIVNHPCDGSDWDKPQASLRECGNAVYIKSDLKQ